MSLRRALVLAGSGSESDDYPVPDWYALIAVARYLGVAPWQLLDQPIWWQHKALVAMTAERQAERILAERARQ